MKKGKQLWISATDDFCLPGFAIQGRNSRWHAPGLRAMFWPSGFICWPINAYLIWCRKRGLEVSTVNAYCSELSSFIRFLTESKLEIFDVVDDDLIDFSDWLPTTRKISGSHINKLILRVINLYEWAQGAVLGSKIVGRPHEMLQISLLTKYSKKTGNHTRVKIHHAAMVASSIPRSVHPMSFGILDKLIDENDKVTKSSFIKKRNRMMIVVLADAGVRREELVSIRATSIREAKDSGFLKVPTSKRRGNPERLIPLPKFTIDALNDYLETSRAILVHQLGKKKERFVDEDWAFCTQYGKRLAPASVTQMFAKFRVGAGIAVVATAHMLRHRFITMQLVARLKGLGRKHYVGVELISTILSKLASITGHSTIENLWRYVDWAYDEVDNDMAVDVGEHERARAIVLSMLDVATEDKDKPLIQDLGNVLAALGSLDPLKASHHSVLTHSLKGRATR